MCGKEREDLQHFILHCPAYQEERRHPGLQCPYQEDEDQVIGRILFENAVMMGIFIYIFGVSPSSETHEESIWSVLGEKNTRKNFAPFGD